MPAPPIALSIDDPDIDREVASWIEVLLDGQVQNAVLAYDCRAGTLTRTVRDAGGQPLICRATETYRTETVHGRVEVRWRPGTPPA